MTDITLKLATILGTRTTAEVEAILPAIVQDTGALWFTLTSGVSTFIFADRAMSSDHSPAEAARLWGVGIMSGKPPEKLPLGLAGRAGVMGEMIDPFLLNTRGA